MKLEFSDGMAGALQRQTAQTGIYSETDPLTELLLCRPTYLEAVPCCSVTRECRAFRRRSARRDRWAAKRNRKRADRKSGYGAAYLTLALRGHFGVIPYLQLPASGPRALATVDA